MQNYQNSHEKGGIKLWIIEDGMRKDAVIIGGKWRSVEAVKKEVQVQKITLALEWLAFLVAMGSVAYVSFIKIMEAFQ